jgi:hypothetical protein
MSSRHLKGCSSPFSRDFTILKEKRKLAREYGIKDGK